MKLKKILLSTIAAVSLLTSCGGTTTGGGANGKINIDQVNEFLNGEGMGNANVVAIIPFTHINGPREEWKFFAMVNFTFKARSYIKYQVTYLSCTCRSADVNYWSTAYMELSLPSDNDPKSIELKALSYDKDGESGHYTAGFWGDSNPVCSESTGNPVATYEKTEGLPSFKEDYIPLLIGKTKEQFDTLSTVDDLTEKIDGKDIADVFAGASVSTNNIIRIVKATMDYHAETYVTKK